MTCPHRSQCGETYRHQTLAQIAAFWSAPMVSETMTKERVPTDAPERLSAYLATILAAGWRCQTAHHSGNDRVGQTLAAVLAAVGPIS